MVLMASPVCLFQGARLAEVEATEQLADEEDVGALGDLRAQRRVVAESGKATAWAEVGEAAEDLAGPPAAARLRGACPA